MKGFTHKASRSLAWTAYVVILFEMIYMATPFAVYFYSVYGGPLRFLAQRDSTAWLVQNILPHFTQTNSFLINGLLYASWPLMGIGFLIFLAGFCQVYWSKVRRKGAVVGGLYRIIRHPQYLGWALFGLGMALAWSRMIVWIMFVSMLFVYALLASREEEECLQKFGESYRVYLERTARFMPRLLHGASVSQPLLHCGRFVRPAALIVLFPLAIGATILLGFIAREHALHRISAYYKDDLAAISLTPLREDEIKAVLGVPFADASARDHLDRLANSHPKRLIYILPSEWAIPELGLEVGGSRKRDHGFNPTNHGNPSVYDRNRYRMLVSEAVVEQDVKGKDILSKARGQVPLLLIGVDLKEGRVTELSAPANSRYADLPVPVF